MADSADRRQYPRHSVAVRVHVTQLGEVSGALARDISEGGLFIESAIPYPVGACVPLRLIHPQSLEQVAAICEVVRHVHSPDGKFSGLGLRFTSLDGELLETLRRFVGEVGVDKPLPSDLPAPVEPGPAEAKAAPQPRSVPAAGPVSVPPSAARQSDTGLAQMMPLDAVPVASERSHADLHDLEVHLLSLVDGKKTADGIAQESGVSLVEALAGLLQLKRRGVIQIGTGSKPAAAATAPAAISEREREAKRNFADQRVRDYLSEAVRCERGGRIADAVNVLEQALALKPPNAREIHLRLARLALGPLNNLTLAQRYTDAIVRADPESAEGKQLVADIAARRQQSPQPAKSRDRVRPPPEEKGMSRRGKVIAAAAAVLVFALLVFNAWRFVPHGPQPKRLDPAAIATMLPCTSARLLDKRLYVTIDSRWQALSAADKEARLGALATWARKQHGALEVLASDSQPVIVGKVSGGQVKIYR